MQRRNLLKAVGGIGAATAVGGVGLATMGGAAASSHLDIADTSISNDTGDVTSIAVSLDHTVEFDGFDYPVEAAAYEDYIVQLNQDGSEYARHKLYDNTNNPVMLENWSSEGNGGDGWGGPGEHTSGPGTEGDINANIDWTVVSETPGADGNTESPGDAADFALDHDDDGSSKTRYFVYEKRVHLYGTRDNGATAVSTEGHGDASSVAVYPLGQDDGTVGVVESSGRFNVDVTNEESTSSGSGSGNSTAN